MSICIVSRHRHALLDACLAGLAAQEDAPPFELLVCADGDHDVAATVWSRFPDARVALVEKSLPGAARNHLVSVSRGELLLFLDDDVVVHPRLLRRLADAAAEHPDVAVFGGPNLTPDGSSEFQIVQGAVLASIVATGPVRRRWGVHPSGRANERYFTLCNLAVRRAVMVPFASDLVCAEECALLNEMDRRGLEMHYDGDLAVDHERRASLGGFLRQLFKYGRGRGQMMMRYPRSIRPAYVFTPALLAYLVAAPLLAFVWLPALAPLALYAAAVVAGATKIAWTLRRVAAAVPAAALIVCVHVMYGAGILAGLVTRGRAAQPAVWLEAEARPQHIEGVPVEGRATSRM